MMAILRRFITDIRESKAGPKRHKGARECERYIGLFGPEAIEVCAEHNGGGLKDSAPPGMRARGGVDERNLSRRDLGSCRRTHGGNRRGGLAGNRPRLGQESGAAPGNGEAQL